MAAELTLAQRKAAAKAAGTSNIYNQTVPNRPTAASGYSSSQLAAIGAPNTPTAPSTGLQKMTTPEAIAKNVNPYTGIELAPSQRAALEGQVSVQGFDNKGMTAEEVYQKGMELKKEKQLATLKQNPNISKEYLDMYEQYYDPMTGKMNAPADVMAKVKEAEWAKLPEEKRRNYEAEQAALAQTGVDPANMTNEDQADLLEMVYGNNLPDIIKSGQVDSSVFSLDRLTEMGITTDRIGQWVANGEITQDTADALLAQLGDTMARGAQAEADVNATPNPTNKMMGILSEALNAKNNFKNQKLGTSDLFAMAGLSGYAVLAQSLAQRGNEMKQKSMSAANVISSVGGAMAENYKAVTDNYNRLAEQYDKQVDRLLKIDEQAKDHEFALDEINARLEADKKLAQFEFNLDQKEKAAEADAQADLYGDSGYVAGIETNDKVLKDVFNVGGTDGWCGVYASKYSTAPAVGDSWASKSTKITHQTSPQPGQKLLIPLGVSTDGKGYGHVAITTSYNPETNTVSVVEANRDGRMNRGSDTSVVTTGVYNLDKLQAQYGDDWGFTDGTFKKEVWDKLALSMPEVSKEEKAGTQFQGKYNMSPQPTSNVVKTITGGLDSRIQPTQTTGSFADRYLAATGEPLKLQPEAEQKRVAKLSADERESYLTTLENKATKVDDTKRKYASDQLEKYMKQAESEGVDDPEMSAVGVLFDKLVQVYGTEEEAAKILSAIGYDMNSGGASAPEPTPSKPTKYLNTTW